MFEIDKMPKSIDIGYTGETCFRDIKIDMSAWMEKMPEGIPSIILIRPWETKEDAYIAATTFEDNILTWVITDADLGTQEGEGLMQIWLEKEVNNSVKKRGKSVKVTTRVVEAADDPAEDPPAAQQAWITQMTALKVATVNAAEEIKAAVAHNPTISETTGNWLVWDAQEGKYVDTGVPATGDGGAEIKDSTETGSDLDISDPTGNVIVRLKNGHIQTKHFDSAEANKGKIKDSTKTGVDLDVSDSSGNVIMRLKDGEIKTKNFDSKYFKKPFEEYTKTIEYNSSATNTITIIHSFKKGDEIYYHLEDGNRYDSYGRYAAYYEGSKLVIANRRGSNGYTRHVITADCESVGITVAASEYTNKTSLTLHVYKINGKIEPKIVTVKADGTGMFETIKEAVDSITDANHLTNPYVIEVYPGTYDCLEGYTDEEIASAADTPYTQDSMVGIKLRDGISIRGVGRCEDIILTAELSTTDWDSDVRGQISTLNIEGEGNIENMTIIGKYIRYCVHDDFISPTNSHDKRILRNLIFKGKNLSYYPLFTTYGAGATAPRDYLIENCNFGYDLGIHTDGGYPFGCTIEIKNCSGNRFRLGDYANAEGNAKNRIIMNDCDFQMLRISHSDTSLSSHVKIEGTGCEKMIIQDTLTDLYRLGMIMLAPTGLTTGKMVKRESSGLGFEATDDATVAEGIVIGSDNEYSYIQHCGYIASNYLSLNSLALGDYVTVDNTGSVVTGGTASNAVGVVKMIDLNGNAQIKMLI